VHKADNLPPSCTVVTKSGSLNFLESSGSLQACNGTDLPFTHPRIVGLTQFFSKSNGLKHMMYKLKYVHNLEEVDGWSSRKRMGD